MKNFYALFFFVFTTLHVGANEPLRMQNMLGKHDLGSGGVVEIYSDTRGEIHYSFLIDGEGGSGGRLNLKVGEPFAFWFDAPLKILWMVTPRTVYSGDYSKPNSTSGRSTDIGSADSLNPPPKVKELIRELRGKAEAP